MRKFTFYNKAWNTVEHSPESFWNPVFRSADFDGKVPCRKATFAPAPAGLPPPPIRISWPNPMAPLLLSLSKHHGLHMMLRQAQHERG